MYTEERGMYMKRAPRVRRPTEIGALLRAKRRSEGWSVREAGERIGIEGGTLSDLENGIRRPEFESLVGIHRAYGVPLEELVRMAARDAGIELPPALTVYRDRAASLAARAETFPDLARILDRLSAVDPEGYRAFLLMLELWDRLGGQGGAFQT